MELLWYSQCFTSFTRVSAHPRTIYDHWLLLNLIDASQCRTNSALICKDVFLTMRQGHILLSDSRRSFDHDNDALTLRCTKKWLTMWCIRSGGINCITIVLVKFLAGFTLSNCIIIEMQALTHRQASSESSCSYSASSWLPNSAIVELVVVTPVERRTFV